MLQHLRTVARGLRPVACGLRPVARGLRQGGRLLMASLSDAHSFARGSALLRGGGRSGAQAQLLKTAHRLDKGLALPKPRPGFGQETAARAESIAMQVQNAGVVGDGAASPEAIAKVGDALSWGSTCFFPRGVNHSLLSRHDSPDEDKYWIPAVLEQAVRFAAEGRTFERAGAGGVGGYPLCRTR